MPDERKTSRRRFLTTALWGAAAAGVGGMAYGAWYRLSGRRTPGAAPAGGGGATESALLTHRPAGELAVDLRRLRALALGPEGRLYVAGDQSINIYTVGAGLAQAALVGTIKLENGGSGDGVDSENTGAGGVATCLAAAPDGRLFAGVDGRIVVFDAAGRRTAMWTIPEGQPALTSIAVGADAVLAADWSAKRVWRFDMQGACVGAIGSPARPGKAAGFEVPSPYFDVTLGGGDSVWVANPGQHRVEHYGLDGAFRGSWGTYTPALAGFCGCCNPSYLTLWPVGAGGLMTSEKGTPRIKVYDYDGHLRGVVAGPEQLAGETQGLDAAPDARGRVFVLAPRARKVLLFEPLEPSSVARG